MGKTTRASITKKSRCSTASAEKEPVVLEGWITLGKFLRGDCKELRWVCPDWGSLQLIHVISCSRVGVHVSPTWHDFVADVNWYTGGYSTVTLPTAVAEKKTGVYLARAKHIRWHYPPSLARLASITNMRWLGTRDQIVKMANERGRDLDKNQLQLLIEMLSVNSVSTARSEIPSEFRAEIFFGSDE